MKNEYLSLMPADRVIVPKSQANLVKHHGIYAGIDANGQHWFLENHYTSGVRYVTSDQFLSGTSINKIRVQRFTGTEWQRQNAMKVAKSMIGRSYDLLAYNCEHYSNEVQFGQADSEQVKTGLLVAGLVVCLFGVYAISR